MLKDYKISSFSHNISALPDYPSGTYTARQLKEYFDGNSGEIKTKYNALIDALEVALADMVTDVDSKVLEHQMSENAHEELFAELRKMIITEVSDKVTEEEFETIISGFDLILSGKADSTELEKKVDKTVFNAHVTDVDNPHNVTADQVGTYTAAEIDALIARAVGNVDLSGYYTKGEVDAKFVTEADYANDMATFDQLVYKNIDDIAELKASIGDIASALDELHEYAISLAGGEG